MKLTQVLFEWVLTSAFLILAVLVLRALLGRRVSAGLRYALWAVVLVRLLVPVQLFTTVTSIMRETGMEQQLMERPLPSYVSFEPPPSGTAVGQPAITEPVPNGVAVSNDVIPAPAGPEAGPLAVLQVLGWLWLTGALVMAAAFIVSNVSFARRLRRVREPLEGADCPLPVCLAAGLPSPCLFGLLRPAVYVTPETAEDPVMLRHVLAHEYTHFRHGDHIWNVLRSAALTVHWWNPLVWLSVILSRRDCELACDEGALKRLGQGERFAYGRTLLALITVKPRAADLLRCATTMTGGHKSVWERVERIARSPKRWLWAAVAAVLVTAAACVCAFGAARYDEPLPSPGPAEESQPPAEESQPPAAESSFPEQWLDNRQVLAFHPDLNRNGVPEDLVTYDLMFYEQVIGSRLEVQEGDELLWWAEDSASFCPVFLCRVEGQEYLLRYLPETSQPEAYQGPSFYQYDLLTLEEGPEMTVYQNGLRETVVQHRDVYFDFNVGRPSFTGQFDPESIAHFMVNVNYLLNKSVPLFDLDPHTQSTFDQTGHPEDTLWWLDSAEPIFTRDEDKSLLENLQAYQQAMEDYYSPAAQIPGYDGSLDFEFYAVEAGMPLRFSNLTRAVTPSTDITFHVEQFTIMDLDHDGVTELILRLDGQGGSLVFHPAADGIYCYHEVPRGLQDLKTDGTSRGSSGAGDWGFYKISAFTPSEMKISHFTWCESTDPPGELYFVDSAPATRREFEAAAEAQSKKEDVQWQAWTDKDGGPAEVIWWLDAAGAVWLAP